MARLHTTSNSGSQELPETVKVWDAFVRIFHWTLVLLFVSAVLTSETAGYLHQPLGYAIAGLLGARLVWGFIGSKTARFRDFVYRPATIAGFLRDSLRGRAQRYIGHNPAGGAMVIALIVAIGGTCILGFMMMFDMFWGVEWVEEAHECLAWATVGLVGLHVLGVILASLEHRENLIRAMFTGRKRP